MEVIFNNNVNKSIQLCQINIGSCFTFPDDGYERAYMLVKDSAENTTPICVVDLYNGYIEWHERREIVIPCRGVTTIYPKLIKE